MKEITRRLYTKPVMFGLVFLVGIGLVVGLFITAKSRASVAFTVVEAGDDQFETTGDGQTYHNFQGDSLDAGFFTSESGSPSLEFTELVPLVGVPLSPLSQIDTVISRNEDVTVPGTTSLTMTQLSLASISPITIHYSDGTQEDWDVHVGLSALKSSTGSMSIESGGTFDSTLKVWPKFTFTSRLNGDVVELDTGSGSGLMASAVADGSDIEPMPVPTIAPCPVATADRTETQSFATVGTVSNEATGSNCPPVTLTSNNSPWQICPNGKFCIPQPISEAELLASHRASPPGTKKKVIRVVAQPASVSH